MTKIKRAKNSILLEMIYNLEIQRNKLAVFIGLNDKDLFLYSEKDDLIYLQEINKIIVELQNKQYKIIHRKEKKL